MNKLEKHTYTTGKYILKGLFSSVIRVANLEDIHSLGGFGNVGNTPGDDNNSFWHERFYSKMRGTAFAEMYFLFIKNEIAPKFNEPIVYQKYPTLRIQIPNGKGVAAYHVDSEYNHPIDEMNIWLPFTYATGTRSIYIESEPGKGDYTPQDVKYGEYLMFEGGRLSHGNEVNRTGLTRVSIDMRVIPVSKYKPSDLKGLSHGKVRSTEGENAYYDIMK